MQSNAVSYSYKLQVTSTRVYGILYTVVRFFKFIVYKL